MLRDLATVTLVIFLLAFAAMLKTVEKPYLPASVGNVTITPEYGVVRLRTGLGELPIYVSRSQAAAIADALNGTKHFRPTTHDIAAKLAMASGARALYIEKLEKGTYYATLETREGKIDIRPSDGIVICIKIKCPIYVNPALLKS